MPRRFLQKRKIEGSNTSLMPRTAKSKGGTKSDGASSSASASAQKSDETQDDNNGVVETTPLYTRVEQYAGPLLFVPLIQCGPHPEPIRGVHKDAVLKILLNIIMKGKNTHTPTHPYTKIQTSATSIY
jgi:hypothetical protein